MAIQARRFNAPQVQNRPSGWVSSGKAHTGKQLPHGTVALPDNPKLGTAPSSNYPLALHSHVVFLIVFVALSRINPYNSQSDAGHSRPRQVSNRQRPAADNPGRAYPLDSHGMAEGTRRTKFALFLLLVQTIFIILFFVYTDYDQQAKPGWAQLSAPMAKNRSQDVHRVAKPSPDLMSEHGAMFQDTFFFVVSAFALAYCFASRHNISSVAGAIFITAISAQWGMLCRGFIFSSSYPIPINVLSLLGGVGSACLVLVSWGALLGKLSPLQLLTLVILEVPLALLVEWLATSVLQTKDVGGSMLTHEFGAYFGVAVSAMLYRKEFVDESNLSPTPTAAFRCLIGTMIFWVFWPTAIAAPLEGPDRHVVLINVYIAMLASCIATFTLSSLLDKEGKFEISHVQNATIAGGVAVGTAADTLIGPGGALCIGALGAIVTILGMTYLQPVLTTKLGIHDTAGVHNLHGLVGILAGAAGAVAAAIAQEDIYGPRLYNLFPAMAPQENTSYFHHLQEIMPDLEPGLGRSPALQAGFQAATMVLCCIVPIIGGVLTGFILRAPFFEGPPGNQLYLDAPYWRAPDTDEDNGENSSVHSIPRSNSATDRTVKVSTVSPM